MFHPDPVNVVDRGRKCAEMLVPGSIFNDVLDYLSTYHIAAMTACPPGEAHAATLTFHHQQHASVIELAQTVAEWAAAGAELENAQADTGDFEE